MKIAVRYLSKSGNTKKIAEIIATAVGVTALPISDGLNDSVDLLFLGGALYAFGIDDELKEFIKKLQHEQVKGVVVFSTTAVVKSAYPHIKKALAERGIATLGKEFHCRGQFSITHKNRPNEQDCESAREFAKQFVK
ncbi:hypothetical protein AGMMS49975_23170 [Clostridia bacterium]|nr:hypothetical protein AGMMS49975_23170 [Clostridia bacterium]